MLTPPVAIVSLLCLSAAVPGCRDEPAPQPGGVTSPPPAAEEPGTPPMSQHFVGVWRLDLDGTLALKQPGLGGTLMQPWDLEDRYGMTALAYRDGRMRPIRLVDGRLGPALAVTVEDRPFGDAWLKFPGGDGTAHLRRDGDDGGVVLDDDEVATRWVRAAGLDPDWEAAGVDLEASPPEATVEFCGQRLAADDPEVVCDRAEVTDVAPLAAMRWLRALDLTGTGVTDLRGLGEPGWLVEVDLRGTGVTDLAPLRHARFLNKLDVAHTPIADVTPLHGARWLTFLQLDGTAVSREGLDALRAAHAGRDRELIISGCRHPGSTPCRYGDE